MHNQNLIYFIFNINVLSCTLNYIELGIILNFNNIVVLSNIYVKKFKGGVICKR